MTDTTTDAAEARALKACPFCGGDDPRLFYNGFTALWNIACDTRSGKACGAFLARFSEAAVIEAWNNRATAEAASGAGEREDVANKVATLRDEMATGKPRDWYPVHRDWLTAILDAASLPPATDPAMVEAACERSWEVTHATLWRHLSREVKEQWAVGIRAALAAAPTIPATGEAVPEGMKPWHGGDAAPDDLDLSGKVLREDGQTEAGRDVTIQQWKRPVPRCKWNIIAYTPKATIPATGHAVTEGEGA